MSSREKIAEMPLKWVEEKRYPSPLASHDEVVRNQTVFWDTLRRFHSVLGTKFMVPVIGGKELDLHVLYVEVTRRGGFDKVVTDKKWRDVSAVFNFSPTTTSASFVLRKHYAALLHHYEQVYFFKLQGPLLTPTAETSSCQRVISEVAESSCESMREFEQQSTHLTGASSAFPVIGTIDGKFDCGYLVTVKMGSEVLHGVLYHPSLPGSFSPGSSSPRIQTNNAVIPWNPTNHLKRRRKKGGKGRDPSRPKPNRSGYNFFFAEKHSKLKTLYPTREREFTKMIGESWSKLSPEDRMVYQNIGLKDKERYKREMKEYKERLTIASAAHGS